MPLERMFLVRDAEGKMRTVMARSTRAAAALFLESVETAPGDVIEVKERGRGDWEAFRVS